MATPPLNLVILKVASRCNLNCSYCYMYNRGDETWRDRPKRMADAVFDATLERIASHAAASGQRDFRLTFHGGEPTMIGAARFTDWVQRARSRLEPALRLHITMQTNATLIDDAWGRALAEAQATVGVSMDGPAAIHDAERVDHRGRGSHMATLRGLDALRRHGVPFGILCVMPLGADPLPIHRHFVGLAPDSVSYLMPDCTHEEWPALRALHGETPCADFLMPIFAEWLDHGPVNLRISNLWHMVRLLMGGSSRSDVFGNAPFGYMVVETDGAIEGLDCLRGCGPGMTSTGINVLSNDFMDVRQAHAFHASVTFDGLTMPSACGACPERDTCGGGYLPHRYSRARGFDNPSVWCRDHLKLFQYLRERLDLPARETAIRRQALAECMAEAAL